MFDPDFLEGIKFWWLTFSVTVSAKICLFMYVYVKINDEWNFSNYFSTHRALAIASQQVVITNSSSRPYVTFFNDNFVNCKLSYIWLLKI